MRPPLDCCPPFGGAARGRVVALLRGTKGEYVTDGGIDLSLRHDPASDDLLCQQPLAKTATRTLHQDSPYHILYLTCSTEFKRTQKR